MNQIDNVIELKKLYQYLYGAYHATNDDNAGRVLHTACHRLEEIINAMELQKATFAEGLAVKMK